MSIVQHEFELPPVAEQLEHPNGNGSGVPVEAERVAKELDQPAAIPLPGANWHAEAGRKGAQRIHQLIQAGKLYEQEHGLKPGRQRLRQLIAEGKLYEQEHGLSNGRRPTLRRPKRLDDQQSLKLLVQLLVRVAKPKFREQLLRVLQDLENEPVKLREGA